MNQYIVTIKEYQKGHNPRNKKTGVCPVSTICTDKTGHHHSLLVESESVEEAHKQVTDKYNIHITRIEKVD